MGRPAVYEASFKVSIAREFLSGALSLTDLARKYNLPNKGTVNSMVVWYRRNYGTETPKSTTIDPVKKEQEGDKLRSKADSIKDKAKDRQLEDALLKVEALELLLANAKKELGIDLLKKYGTKQPNK